MTVGAARHPGRRPPGRWLRVIVAAVAAFAAAFGVGAAAPIADAARAAELPVDALATGATVPAQDYPYQRPERGLALDPNGFVVGQCTSFVAWWLTAHGVPLAVITRGPGGVGTFLNASGWDSAARAAGFQVGTVPVVGAVAQWHAHESSERRDPSGGTSQLVAGAPGHVAVVTAVRPDGQAEWLDMGWAGQSGVHVGHGTAPRYLYLGVTPPG